MTVNKFAIAAFGLAIIAGVRGASAGAKDYEFLPISADVKNGAGNDLAVRLVHKSTGKPVG